MFQLYTELAKEKFQSAPDLTTFDKFDLTNKVYIVTGASGGIGAHVSKVLAKQGAKVYLAGRNIQKLNQIIENIKQENEDAKISSIIMDFDDLTTIKYGADTFLQKEDRLDGIVHNAGVMIKTGVELTKQGYERQIGVNCLAPHLLQRYLNDIIVKTTDSRVVWVTSAGHFASPEKISYDDMGWTKSTCSILSRYYFSKLVNLVQASEWAENISMEHASIAVHPGVIGSDLYRGFGILEGAVMAFCDTVENGAHTELYALLCQPSKECSGKNAGAYAVPYKRLGQKSKFANRLQHSEEGQKLWKWLNEQTDKYL